MEKELISTPSLEEKKNDVLRKTLLKQKIILFLPLVAAVVLLSAYVIGAIINGYNLSIGLNTVISNATLVAILATGASFIFSCGSFDISLGNNMLVSALVGGLVGAATGSLILMLITCVIVAVAVSLFNATLACFFKMPVFIMTIAMMSVLLSLSKLIITKFGSNSTVNVPIAMVSGLDNMWFRIGVLIVFVGVANFIFYKLKLGRRLKFIGGNPVCGNLSGLNKTKMTIIAFLISGFGVGLAAFNTIVMYPTLSSTSASSVGMDMLLVIVFGGMILSGGVKSKMYAAIVGSISISALNSFMNLFLTNQFWYIQLVKGVLFLIVVYSIYAASRSKLLER